jgi:hypothetical protein
VDLDLIGSGRLSSSGIGSSTSCSSTCSLQSIAGGGHSGRMHAGGQASGVQQLMNEHNGEDVSLKSISITHRGKS